MLYPEISGTWRSVEDGKTKFFVWDLMLGHSYSLDPYDAMNDKANAIVKISDLPANTLSVLPYKDSLQFVINIENDDILFNVINHEGKKMRAFRLYPDDISAEQYLSAFSNCISVNSEKCMAALAMVALPQINFLNLEDGSVKSVAVDRKYRDWRNILKSESDISAFMKSMRYYYDTESTRNYIMALYLNRTIETFTKHIPGHSPHIHIFDWKGNFLYDIQINESITSIAYDSRRKFMYGLDRDEGRIYRYDMSRIL